MQDGAVREVSLQSELGDCQASLRSKDEVELQLDSASAERLQEGEVPAPTSRITPSPTPQPSPHTAKAPSSPARIPTINADPLPSSAPAPSRCPQRLGTITSNASWCRGGSGGSMAGLSLAAGACNAMNGALRNHWHGHHRRSRQRRSRPLAGFALTVLVVGSFTTVSAPCAMREEEEKAT
jgi:hypothetical protein